MAFYRARYGEIEYVEVDFEIYEEIIERFEKLLDMNVYKEKSNEKMTIEHTKDKRTRKRTIAKIKKKKGPELFR